MLGLAPLSATPLSSLPAVVSGAALTVTGVTRDRCREPDPGATVILFRSSDNIPVASTTSDASGTYTFTDPAGQPFWAAVFSADGTWGGVTQRNLIPS